MNSPKGEEAETGADFVCGGNTHCNKLSCFVVLDGKFKVQLSSL